MILEALLIWLFSITREMSFGYWVGDAVRDYYSGDCVIIPYEFFTDSSKQLTDSLVIIQASYQALESLFSKHFTPDQFWIVSGLKVKLTNEHNATPIVRKKSCYTIITPRSLISTNEYRIVSEPLPVILKNYLEKSRLILLPDTDRYEVARETSGSGLININTASLEELMSLPGIGPKIAQEIINYRTRYGPFTHISEIKKVQGIGEKRYQRIKDLIRL